LRKGNVDIFSTQRCQSIFPNAGINGNKQFCAANHIENVDTCGGDSGGPLLVVDGNSNVM